MIIVESHTWALRNVSNVLTDEPVGENFVCCSVTTSSERSHYLLEDQLKFFAVFELREAFIDEKKRFNVGVKKRFIVALQMSDNA